jgi:acyl carrier protein
LGDLELDKRPDEEILTAVTAVCRELFAAEKISAADNFFMLGGNSMNAIEMTEELLARYELELPLDAVFTCDTLEELALHCRRAGASGLVDH